MATLDSSSTMAEVQAAYDDNASYAEDESVVKARAFITAVRILIRRMASEAADGSQRLRFDMNLLRGELQEAKAWLSGHDTARQRPRVIHGDFSNFRGPAGSDPARRVC